MVSAFTSGVISSEAPIRVRFSRTFTDSVTPGSQPEKQVFSLHPAVEGQVCFIDQQTIEFLPNTTFDPGTQYSVEVHLSRLFPDAEGSKTFSFAFYTIKQHIQLELAAFRPYSDYRPEMNFITGTLRTADVAQPTLVEATMKAEQDGRELNVEWDHSDDGRTHGFRIDSVRRTEEENKVKITYDGGPVRSGQTGQEVFNVPALGDFRVIGHKLVQYPEQHVVLSFSDPIRKNQSLDGLIRLSNDTDMRYTIDGNMVSAYPNVRQNGNLTLFVEPGIRNTAGKALKVSQRLEVSFREIKPSVELMGNGVIIPNTDEVILPFKAVNLRAVDVKVIRIYEDNISQFLQVNQLSGSSELKRAGRLILKRTIDLVADKAINYGEWNTFSLDLTELVRADPGAIYRVEINFQQSQSVFPCAGDEAEEDVLEEEEDYDSVNDEEISYWDSYESYYSSWDYYSYDGYSWEDREDPCKPAYYGNRRAVSRNILASNLGVIAKLGTGQQLIVTVTDLLGAEPVGNATVKVYNFQQQLMDEDATNNEGMVEFKLEGKPFLVVTEHLDQKGYVRMVDGNALSYSMFDVSGSVVQKGIKGYIYGDRGVWRPGDSLFLNLIVDDRANPLPDNHPVAFSLRDPRGKVIQQRTAPGNETGFYAFHTTTKPDAPTGNYSITAEVGGATFSRIVRVETIKPNRLKIDLTFANDTIYPARGPVRTTLFSKWLTGATARNLRAEVEVIFSPMKTSFEGYGDYTFTNPARKVATYPTQFYSGSIDSEGFVRFSKSLYIDGEAPGMLNAVFTTRVFEQSGEFSIDQKTVPCSPYNTYVGIKLPPGDARGMLLTDTSHTVNVITLSASGKPQTKLGLNVNIFKLDWKWWWDASTENTASYMGSNYQTPVYSTTINTKNGNGSFDFRIDYPEWGRYLVVVSDAGGHSAASMVYVDWPGYAGRSRKGDPDAATVLAFSSDREVYNVGETATITIPSSTKGKILISLENGSRVLRQEWIEASGTETKYSMKITPEMTPNIYVYASLIQPHANTGNDLPIRMFGVIPIRVEDPETRLSPVLDMPDELSPNSTVKIEVSEEYDREMTYTIAMVDEGLLDLTRFRTPDPWSVFYAREALGVRTWDMFEYVLGAYGGRIDGIYSIGGGLDESGEGAKDANRFPPMVKFIGPFTLKGKKNVHTVKIPNYIGSVRTMLVAGNNGKYGHAEKTTPVKQPLMLLATLPRVLGPGEEVALPVNVFVMDESIRKVDLTVRTNDMLIASETQKSVGFSGTGDEIVDFMLKAPDKTGVGKVTVTARSGKHSATYEIELNVRSSNPPVTNTITAAVEASGTYEQDFEYVGMEGTNDLMLEVSNIPPIDFGRRLEYLLRYPHGCIEQTTSAAFPQLFLADVVELDPAVVKKTEENVRAAIKRLSSFQLPGGGFSYWPGSIKESSWGTSYAGHFLLEAATKGYEVPRGILNSWGRYQRKEARRWSISGSTNAYEIRQEQILQAYRLFTLALAGDPEIGAMNRLRERSDLVVQARWRLAAAYALAGQKETASGLVNNASIEIGEYEDSRYTFGNATRDRAMILEAMVLMDRRADAVPLLEQVAKQLSSNRWMSTQTAAYSLIAVSKYTEGQTSSDRLSFQYAFNGSDLKIAETGMPLAQLTFEPGEAMKGTITVVNNTEGMAFIRIINTGLPKPGEEKAINRNLGISVNYYDMEGERLNPKAIPQGVDFKAVYQVRNPGTVGYYSNVALTTIFPSGWEIHNERLFTTSNEIEQFDYQDIRDDRVMTYFSLYRNGSKTITIRLNAAYRGTFYLPSVKGEEMYLGDVQTVIPGTWINVVGRE
jgi:uncharacterized protein YfaS (alpha-2-macroglobulin family)